MTEESFERLLYDESEQALLHRAPPQPWRRPMLLIVWGLALCSITLNFWRLDYLLPAVGTVLVWLGFRILRRENGPFRFAYAISTLAAAYRLLHYVVLATPLAPQLSNVGYGMVGSLLYWLLYLSLWRGLKQVFLKAGQPPKTAAAGALVIWYTLICLLALVNLQGLPAFIILILWVIILICLFRVSRCMDDSGYAVTPAPVSLPDRWAALLWLGIAVAALSLCMVFSQRLSMTDAAPVENAVATQTELRQELLDLGFPEDVLAALSDEEVALLEGARQVSVESSFARDPQGEDIRRLNQQFIMVVLPDDLLRFYFWFSWEEEPDHRLMESIQIQPTMQSGTLSYPADSLAQGRLLWEDGGQTFQLPLSGAPTYGTFYTGLFYSTPGGQRFTVSFSLPKVGTQLRGYLSWTAHPSKPSLALNFNANAYYIHQQSLLNYPWNTPADYHEQGGRGNVDRIFPRDQLLVLFQYPGGEN